MAIMLKVELSWLDNRTRDNFNMEMTVLISLFIFGPLLEVSNLLVSDASVITAADLTPVITEEWRNKKWSPFRSCNS